MTHFKEPGKLQLLGLFATKFAREMATITVTVVSNLYVSRKEKRLADQFVKDYLVSCHPFTLAVIEKDPRNLGLNIHSRLGDLGVPDSKRDVLWTLEEARDERDEEAEDDYGLMLRLLLRFITRMQAVYVWALERKVVKLYAYANLKSNW